MQKYTEPAFIPSPDKRMVIDTTQRHWQAISRIRETATADVAVLPIEIAEHLLSVLRAEHVRPDEDFDAAVDVLAEEIDAARLRR